MCFTVIHRSEEFISCPCASSIHVWWVKLNIFFFLFSLQIVKVSIPRCCMTPAPLVPQERGNFLWVPCPRVQYYISCVFDFLTIMSKSKRNRSALVIPFTVASLYAQRYVSLVCIFQGEDLQIPLHLRKSIM